MSLNSPTELRLILEVPDAVGDDSLQEFLDIANLVVSEDLAGKGLSDGRLKAIEKMVAAHLTLQLSERGGLASSRAGDSQDNYTVMSAMGNGDIVGYALTRYGQQAMLLDTTNTLRTQSMPRLKAQFRVIGACNG